MIIWGTKCRTSEIGNGLFHCPSCGQQHFRHLVVKKWFTLYFIPLFPFSTLGEYVECQGCRQAYKTVILGYQAPAGARTPTVTGA